MKLMNADLVMDREDVEVAAHDHRPRSAHHVAQESQWDHPRVVDASKELLRTIAEVLDIRQVFPRVSAIVKPIVPHDGLALQFSDRAGLITLEASSTADLPAHGWCTGAGDEACIVSDLSRERPALSANDAEALIEAGYRSALIVGSVTQHQTMRLGFFSRQEGAYQSNDVPRAQHVAEYVAVAVAHEQLAAAERDRAEARVRSERVETRVRALADQGEVLPRGKMVGRSEVWQRTLTRALRVASTDTTVFLRGESGTGKEVVARFIHQASPRKAGPFVAINCAALPEQLLESELFGYERGAFTGAHQAKAGHIELAARGVLFLDEVSEMSLTAQAKFLRFLQEREFHRLGGTRMQKANVRVIAASNRDLRQAVERGAFREDLFYRLQVFDIHLPALRERMSDVPLLAEYFLGEFAETLHQRPLRLSDEARDALMAHEWPGNIRELRNALEAATILADGELIEPRHLSLRVKTVVPPSPHDLAAMERTAIENALRRTDWNKAKTARLLGLSRTQLYGRLRRYGMESHEHEHD
jgi:transcriptional regulator with PAS, ATPase and Fis domain